MKHRRRLVIGGLAIPLLILACAFLSGKYAPGSESICSQIPALFVQPDE